MLPIWDRAEVGMLWSVWIWYFAWWRMPTLGFRGQPFSSMWEKKLISTKILDWNELRSSGCVIAEDSKKLGVIKWKIFARWRLSGGLGLKSESCKLDSKFLEKEDKKDRLMIKYKFFDERTNLPQFNTNLFNNLLCLINWLHLTIKSQVESREVRYKMSATGIFLVGSHQSIFQGWRIFHSGKLHLSHLNLQNHRFPNRFPKYLLQ